MFLREGRNRKARHRYNDRSTLQPRAAGLLFALLDDIEDQGYRPVKGAMAYLAWAFRRERDHTSPEARRFLPA
jgi:hypothetical protein